MKIHLEGVNRCNATLIVKYRIATINNMNDANGELKSRSETGFPMKGSRTFLYILLDNELRCSIVFLIE